jgi:cyclophilin family peptidyl-prolyl cis-trans isomerase
MHHWFAWFRRSSHKSRRPSKPAWRLRCYRPNLDVLEDRCLLAAPVVDPIQVPLNIPAAKTLFVPVTASDRDGGTVNISMAPAAGSSNVSVTKRTGDTFLKISVAGFGDMEFELFNDVAPRTVAYITGLVESGFYNGLIFHRVIQGFIIQGGDPTGTGSGGPPGAGATQQQLQQLQFPDEFDPSAIFSGTGQLAMANSGNDTNGSQFFVTDEPTRSLDFNHTIFGQLVRGFDVLQAINNVPTGANDRPVTPVVITSAQIVQDPSAAVFTVTSTGSTTGPVSLTVTATSSTTPATPTTETVTGQVIAGAPNDPPILDVSHAPLNFGQAPTGNPVQNLTTPVDTPVHFTLSSTDLEGDTPIYAVTETDAQQNATVSVDQATGNVTITPNAGFTGLLHFRASVTEDTATTGSHRNNGPDAQVFTVAVGDQSLTATGVAAGVSATEGTSATRTVATFTAADTSLPASAFRVSINWGDGTALDTTTGAVSGANGQFTVTGTHTFAEAGQYAVQVTVTHQPDATTQLAMAQATTTATVADLPLTVLPVAVTATAGKAFTNVPVATFTDANPGTQASDYTATIDWGDGTAPSAGTVQAKSGGGFQVLGSHTYATQGTFAVRVTVNDIGPVVPTPSSGTATSSAVVSAAATGTANQQYVNQLFLDLTGKAPTAQQLSQFSGELDGGKSRLDVVHQIEALPEAKNHQIQQVYQNIFGTGPTAQQLSSGVQFLNNGGKVSALRVRLLSSDQFFRTVGGGTDTGFLNALGRELLHGSLDATTQSRLSQALANGASHLTVLKDLVKTDLQPVMQTGAQNLYQQYLHRAPTSAELSAAVTMLTNEKEKGLVGELVTSNEYFNRAQNTTSP